MVGCSRAYQQKEGFDHTYTYTYMCITFTYTFIYTYNYMCTTYITYTSPFAVTIIIMRP